MGTQGTRDDPWIHEGPGNVRGPTRDPGRSVDTRETRDSSRVHSARSAPEMEAVQVQRQREFLHPVIRKGQRQVNLNLNSVLDN